MEERGAPSGERPVTASGAASAKAGLYIHVPFCKTKCPYCDFYSIVDGTQVDRWLAALRGEMAQYKDHFSSFDSLYIGGGTPSLLDGSTMTALFSAIRDCWSFSPESEITLEANPDDVTGEKLHLYRSLGINRLSLGIQSFDDRDLSFLRRRHTASAGRKAIDLTRASGFDNFGIDLIYGLPGRTDREWMGTLEEAVSYSPAHLSCYQLTVESGTPFGRLKEEGGLMLPDEEQARKLFLETSRFLESRGFIHYEISNFARGEGRISRHNSKYWDHTPYLGLGPGAHSFLDRRRWWNYRSVEQYCDHIERGVKPMEGFESLTPAEIRLERLYFGFRTKKGLLRAEIGFNEGASKALQDLEKSRLIETRGERIVPTTEGFLLADRLPLMFDD